MFSVSAGLLLGTILGVIFHELGHYLFARAAGIPVRLVVVGDGRVFFSFRIGLTRFEWRELPNNTGFVQTYPMFSYNRMALHLYLLGGIAGNLVFAALLVASFWLLHSGSWLETLLVVAMGVQGGFIVGSLWPSSVPDKFTSDHDINDITLLRAMRRGRIFQSSDSAPYVAMLGGYRTEGPASHSAFSLMIYNAYFQLHFERDLTRKAEAIGALTDILAYGRLSREEELFVLDSLITEALLRGDPADQAAAERWSARAMEIGSEFAAIRGARGSVLAWIGQAEAAKTLLEPLVRDRPVPVDRFLSSFYLARAEALLGRESAARKWLDAFNQGYGGDPRMDGLMLRSEAEIAGLLGPFGSSNAV